MRPPEKMKGPRGYQPNAALHENPTTKKGYQMSNVTPFPTGDKPTMSSREIAELCEKRHDHVIRDIEKMLVGIFGDTPDMGDILISKTYDSRGYVSEIRLPKDLTVTLITGYRADLRYRVIKRLEELETKQVVDLNDPAFLRGTLLHYTEKVIALKAQIDEDRPKTDFYDQFCDTDGLYGLQNAARALGCRPNLFIRWLKTKCLFYQGGNLVPKAVHLQRGVFVVKNSTVDGVSRLQTFVTPLGLLRLAKVVPNEIRNAFHDGDVASSA
jgi:phage antirepressor YoqD-like protein